jgi:hypothetical protein
MASALGHEGKLLVGPVSGVRQGSVSEFEAA